MSSRGTKGHATDSIRILIHYVNGLRISTPTAAFDNF